MLSHKERFVMRMVMMVSLTVFTTIFVILTIVTGVATPTDWGKQATLFKAYIWGFFLGGTVITLFVLDIWYIYQEKITRS